MTYTDVAGILTDRNPALIAKYKPLVSMFERMQELFEILNRRRAVAGRLTST